MRTIAILSLFILVTGCKQEPSKKEVSEIIPQEISVVNGITISDPNKVENLSLFILTGEHQIEGKAYMTLTEAMATKEVIVKETGSVNQLSIDNKSAYYVFIHSGDIVKGGKQDRTISYDVIIPPNTKNIPLESFCVEQGRWEQRSNESMQAFGTNTKMLSSRDLKLAAKYEKNQSRVWSKVAEQNSSLNDKLSQKNGYAVDITANESNSSLQLALESKELKKSKDSIVEKLKPLIKTSNAIGFAYAINGEIYGVEVYNNQQLFMDLWDKLLESVVVEAISKDGEDIASVITKKDVATYLSAVKENDEKTAKKLNSITNFVTTKNENGHVVFSTEDLEKKKWVHRSYMKIDTSEVSKNEGRYQDRLLNTRN